jgi:GTPase SAR1 family protein
MTPDGAPRDATLSIKISLAGDSGVGKTSLVRRFVSGTFDDGYISTLGAKVSSIRFSIPDPRRQGESLEVSAAIWDIMGSGRLREVLRDAYFHGAQGLLLVADATRPETIMGLPKWAEAVTSIAGRVPTVVLLNKSDVAEEIPVSSNRLEALGTPYGWKSMTASAKTGENVPAAFELVTRLYVDTLRGAISRAAPMD